MSQEKRVTAADRREKPRKKLKHEFAVSHARLGEWVCMTRDLSLSGAFIEGRFVDLAPGDTVKLAFMADSIPPVKCSFDAAVMRVTGEGIGLKFLSLDMDTYGALLDLTLQG
jgi:hypothetical protein